MVKYKIFLLIFIFGIFTSGICSAYATNIKFQNESFDNTVIINKDSGNITSTGWFNGLFDWIIDSASSTWLQFTGSTLSFNETKLNSTIDMRASSSGGNASWNQTFANDLYYNIAGDILEGNMDVGGYNITNTLFMKYNITGCPEEIDITDEGLTCWDADHQTLSIVTGLGNVIQIGQELTGVGKNKEGSSIYEGQIVYLDSSVGEMPTIKLADASNSSKMSNLAMVTIPECNNEALCPVTSFGYVNDLDTSSFVEGADIYLSSDGSGNITDVKQILPNYNMHIGKVIRSHASSGIILYLPELDIGDGVILHSLGIITDVNVTGDISATQINAYNFVAGNESPSASFRGLGDYYGIGSIKTMEGLYAESKAYGAGLEIMDNDLTVTTTNILTRNATLNATTHVIYDSEANFDNSYVNQFFRVVSSTSSFTGATGEITGVIDSNNLVLSFATAGSNMIVDAVNMTYVVYPHPNFFVGDNGVISAHIGNNPDAKMEIHIPNGTGFHGVYIEDVAGANQHQALTIDVDSKNYDGVVGANIFMSSSIGVDGIFSNALALRGDATGFNNSFLHFIDVNLLGKGVDNDIDVIHIQGLPDDGHIIHMGTPQEITKAYYDNGDGTTSDVTTAFTSQSTDVTLFEEDNSYVYIGNIKNFTSIGISLSTEGNKNIIAEYYYCDGSGTWQTLPSVVDTTNGFTTSGTISFINPDDRGVCNTEVDTTAFANTTNYTYIAIKRTRTAYPGQKPVENLFSISGGGEYFYMDKYGLKPIGSAGAPYVCSQEIAGMTYYDSTAVALLWCDGSSWIEYAETADITVHNNLGGLQGGQAAEYYHLEAGEHSELTNWLPEVTLDNDGNVTSNGWFKGLFNWTTISNYLSFNGATLTLDDTELNTAFNQTQIIWDNNVSWLSTYNATYYLWAYNQTTPAMTYADLVVSVNNDSWSTTYNSTYDTFINNGTYAKMNYDNQGNFIVSEDITVEGDYKGDGISTMTISDGIGFCLRCNE